MLNDPNDNPRLNYLCAGHILSEYDGHETYIELLEMNMVPTWCKIHECDVWDCFAPPRKTGNT